MSPVVAQPVHRLHRRHLRQDNINQTTSYLYGKQLSQHQKHLLLRFANTSNGVMNSLEELTCGLCDNVLIIGAFSSEY